MLSTCDTAGVCDSEAVSRFQGCVVRSSTVTERGIIVEYCNTCSRKRKRGASHLDMFPQGGHEILTVRVS